MENTKHDKHTKNWQLFDEHEHQRFEGRTFKSSPAPNINIDYSCRYSHAKETD